MKFLLRAKTHTLSGTITLPASKSISNRILLIRAMTATPFDIQNLSDADDTVIMQKALDRNDKITDVGPAGTAMRFLTAFYANTPGEKILTGSERMKQRPISMLVDALRQLGARINYLEKEGFPPLHIEGRKLKGAEVTIAGDVSSQFISALMLIGPTLSQPLTIKISGEPLSKPYILMTRDIMRSCGTQVDVNENSIVVQPGRYRSKTFVVEQDWSAAAFWMTFVALSKKSKLLLKGLTDQSVQGDRTALDLFGGLGVQGQFTEKGLELTKTKEAVYSSEWNFRNHPDLVQPAAVAAAGLGIPFRFEGLDNLRLKETDRIAALQTELAKAGLNTKVKKHQLSIERGALRPTSEPFDAHDDHRMVMAFTPLIMLFPELIIRNPMVVAKSYPGFWKQVEKFVDVRPAGH